MMAKLTDEERDRRALDLFLDARDLSEHIRHDEEVEGNE